MSTATPRDIARKMIEDMLDPEQLLAKSEALGRRAMRCDEEAKIARLRGNLQAANLYAFSAQDYPEEQAATLYARCLLEDQCKTVH